MNTRLQTALARREQLNKVKIRLLEIDQQLKVISAALIEHDGKISRSNSTLNRLFEAIGRSLITADDNSPEAIAERDHQLLVERKRLQDEEKLLLFEQKVLQEQLELLPTVEQEIDHLKSLREYELSNGQDAAGIELRNICRRQEELHAYRQHLQEVVISGSRAAGQLLTFAHSIQQLAEAGSLQAEMYTMHNGEMTSTYIYLDGIKKKAMTIGQLMPKYDAFIIELYRLYESQLPAAPERFYRYGPAYLNSLLYRGELRNDFDWVYLEFIKLWRKVNASVDRFKSQIRQIKYQIDYLDTKKDQLLEAV